MIELAAKLAEARKNAESSWQCGRCENRNSGDVSCCLRCHTNHGHDEIWTCPSCSKYSMNGSKKNSKCTHCDYFRQVEEVVLTVAEVVSPHADEFSFSLPSSSSSVVEVENGLITEWLELHSIPVDKLSSYLTAHKIVEPKQILDLPESVRNEMQNKLNWFQKNKFFDAYDKIVEEVSGLCGLLYLLILLLILHFCARRAFGYFEVAFGGKDHINPNRFP